MFKKLLFTIIIIFSCSSIYAQDLISTLNNLANHISEEAVLTTTELVAEKNNILANSSSFQNNPNAIALAFKVIQQHDDTFGALFTTGTSTLGGIRPRTSNGYELENVIFSLMQSIIDYSYSEENLKAYPSIFNNIKFDTSDFFPGPVSQPADPSVSYTVKINGKHMKAAGTPAHYETEDARRPTSCYLAPGSVATVTVPASLVGIGASVLVGTHTWDNSKKPNSLRLDRVSKKYEITNQEITIANPLGGGIYINIPFEIDLGIIDISLKNVVRSPYFANTAANQTSLSEWQNTQRNLQAPWTDFETDKVMIQIPTSWIYAMDDPASVMADWDISMDAISDYMGRPHIRSKTVLYAQVDLQFRGSAFFPGYPQANTTYNPYTDYGGNHSDLLIVGPRNSTSGVLSTLYHELGHAERMYKFKGEVEALVNFLWVAVYNKAFGVDLDEAFEGSRNALKHTIDEAAISWMIAENFRLGNPMSSQSGQFRQEFAYQPRGYGKYADIVKLFGWEALEKLHLRDSEEYENGTYAPSNQNQVPKDDRILRMSEAAGYDLTPLMHFWGVHPDNPSALAANIANIDAPASADIYDLLLYYKTIVPMDNASFKAFGLNDYSESAILGYNLIYQSNVAQSYYQGFLQKFWDSYGQEEGQAAVDEVQNIIDLYFPDGRPIVEEEEEEEQSFIPDPDKTYYLDVPEHSLRLAATGESEDAYTTSTNTTGADVEWKFVDKGNGYWHIQRAAGGSKPRLRTDSSLLADMQPTTNSGTYTYYGFTKGANQGTHHITLANGPQSYQRLQIHSNGEVRFVTTHSSGAWESWNITEVKSSNKVVHIRKRNALDYAIDGKGGANNGQNVHLWTQNPSNVNQQWIEINRGDGYYSYQKQGTNYCMDGGDGGEKKQNVQLWECQLDNENQQWQKVDMGLGYFQLKKRNAVYVLDGRNGGANGQNVQLWSSSTKHQNTQWLIEEITDSNFKLTENEPIPDIKVYPNPSTGELSIDISNYVDKEIHIVLSDLSGKVLHTQSIDNPHNQILNMDISAFQNGIYLLSVHIDDYKVLTKKISLMNK